LNAIVDSVEAAKAEQDRPTVIVAHTVKGKGVPFMENDNAWHKGVPNNEELALALAALGGDP
jgi:transketolase